MVYQGLLLRGVVLVALGLQVRMLCSYEYVYPVAYTHTPYGTRTLLMYQDADGGPSLYTWDPKTKIVRKGVPSHYTPTYVTVLPDESGFSFIDNGILRIKTFAKRSARTIEMLDPLYDFYTINWIDNNRAYTSAKRREWYEIVELDCEGTVESILALNDTHCTHPQKVNTVLFYIESSVTHPYASSLARIDYPCIDRISLNFNDNDHFDYRVQRIIQHDFERDTDCHADVYSRVLLCDLGALQVIGFTMTSEDEGMLAAVIAQKGVISQCGCFNVRKIHNDQYGIDLLFTFSIPVSPFCTSGVPVLYESFVPLLPVKDNEHGCIYFSDIVCSDGYLALFVYDMLSKTITRISPQNQEKVHFFTVLSTPEGTWYGGSIESRQQDMPAPYTMPYLWINEDQMVCLQLPEVRNCSKNPKSIESYRNLCPL